MYTYNYVYAYSKHVFFLRHLPMHQPWPNLGWPNVSGKSPCCIPPGCIIARSGHLGTAMCCHGRVSGGAHLSKKRRP